MKTIFKQTSNFTAVDKFNIKMAKSLKDAADKILTVSKAVIGEDADQDGQVVQAGALVTDDGAYATISSTAVELIDALIDIMTDNDNQPIKVKVEMRKANNGRDYIVLSIAD